MNHEAIAAARVVVNGVLDVQPTETVIVTNDTFSTAELSHLLAGAVRDAGAIPIEISIPRPPFPGADLPRVLAAASQNADVWIELNDVYMLGTEAEHRARAAGLRRFYSLSGMTVDDLINLELHVDRAAMIELGQRLADLTSGHEELTITCRNGSQFRASIKDRVAAPDLTTMTLGQTHISPIEESAEGRLVFDGSAYPPESLGVLRDSIAVDFSKGLSHVASAGRESELMAQWQASIRKPEIHKLNHVSYGYHPNVPFPTGRLVADERVFGCLCIGFGPPQPYSCHNDLTILAGTLEVDGRPIQSDGRYVDQRIRELARFLGAPGY